jgi:hypothetical protein
LGRSRATASATQTFPFFKRTLELRVQMAA